MSYQQVRDIGHSEKVARKCDRILGLEALLQTYEMCRVKNGGSTIAQEMQVQKLKEKLYVARNQLKNMRP